MGIESPDNADKKMPNDNTVGETGSTMSVTALSVDVCAKRTDQNDGSVVQCQFADRCEAVLSFGTTYDMTTNEWSDEVLSLTDKGCFRDTTQAFGRFALQAEQPV